MDRVQFDSEVDENRAERSEQVAPPRPVLALPPDQRRRQRLVHQWVREDIRRLRWQL